MGYVYQRGNKLWIGVVRPNGKTKQLSTGLAVGKEKEAADLCAQVESKLRAEVDAGGDGVTALTVRLYAKRWIAERHKAKIDAAFEDESRIKFHVLPRIGDLAIAEIRPRHIQTLVKELKAEGKLAPRSVRHVYGVLHKMFGDAQADEVIPVNPCVVKRGDLPKKVDKVPGWRRTAVFSHDELELLISSPLIPENRRVLYGLMFLGGLRFGEASALTWSSYDDAKQPLAAIGVIAAYNTKRKVVKGVKTDQPREVPVHPALQKLLQRWKTEGWRLFFLRHPTPRDLIVPSAKGTHQSVRTSLKAFHADLERVALRSRRQHDARRTFISLSREDGARSDLLEPVTHGPRGNIMNVYTTFPWPALCGEVSKLNVQLRDTETPEAAPPVDASDHQQAEIASVDHQPAHLQPTYSTEQHIEITQEKTRRGWDSNPR